MVQVKTQDTCPAVCHLCLTEPCQQAHFNNLKEKEAERERVSESESESERM